MPNNNNVGLINRDWSMSRIHVPMFFKKSMLSRLLITTDA